MDAAIRSLAARLDELAQNLWWTWQPDVVAIFRDLDPVLWRQVNHNPVAFVAAFPPEQLARRAQETVLDSRINFAFHRLEQYLQARDTWGNRVCGVLRARPVAYFSAEFALHESLPIYSGGLGALAGDHVKGASDLDVPLVGVGLFYGRGYFQHRVDAEGWQQESYGQVDLDLLPLRRALAPDGQPLVVEILLDGAALRIGAWRAEVGRTTLLLLDTNLDGNPPALRELAAQLYGGDLRVRIRQELVLGVGGMRMLAALGVRPGVLHLNEGHSAFAPLELARAAAAAEGVPFAAAHDEVALRTVFTTHTPVTAGHDYFPPELVLEHLGWLASETGIAPEDLLALGRVKPDDEREPFCMTVLALRSARYRNGVSALHGHVSRRMWQALWPGREEIEVPIGHITNGVHTASWLAPQMFVGYDHYVGREWRERLCCPETWERVEQVDDAALWEIHQVLKRHMLNYVLRRCHAQAAAHGEDPARMPCGAALDAEVLTLAFARRFAEYKRPALLLADLDRLERLVNAPGRGIQLVFAGKAHPRDEEGKRLLQRVVGLARDPRFRARVVFVEDYDFSVTRHLVQGADVWLNTPRRPLEACGTSGQKALFNGALHLSVLDGWWAEAYDGTNGFAIGDGQVHHDPAVQDARDADALYRVLEEEVVPLYYEHDASGVPLRWVARMKRAVATLAARCNADRMVRDYVLGCYLPAAGGLASAMPGHGGLGVGPDRLVP
jgi:starch phosphorylase